MVINDFPCSNWSGTEVCFLPRGAASDDAAVYAALLFAFVEDRCALADIAERGWCIPGGRLEPDETPEGAIRREAYEEAGLDVGPLTLLGHYRLAQNGSVRLVALYGASIISMAPLPHGTESRGVRLAAFAELSSLYYLWDPLIAAVCRYAFALRSSFTPYQERASGARPAP